ncbi:hypothetical protein NC797_14985 [Aquibacillus sp. 3ASR75-11]|uniref:Uncharacterized protein n=1 Tax=Terrihalobacillus insolitus TaxID=2950438 RepID=A0A9X3WX54_9BACI|nr:hypothetical protein [Terrihalobacillus insolitus]MDC3414335.1 hypothetical protein [Terrihalobacillus insolitus]MDC3425811.1 hypothetical protein [Terrihalobacillus insolitus]
MKRWLSVVLCSILFTILIPSISYGESIKSDMLIAKTPHNWEVSNVDYTKKNVRTHDYKIFDNFIRKTRQCDVDQKIKTVVWYCDLHGETKSATYLLEREHSEQHK